MVGVGMAGERRPGGWAEAAEALDVGGGGWVGGDVGQVAQGRGQGKGMGLQRGGKKAGTPSGQIAFQAGWFVCMDRVVQGHIKIGLGQSATPCLHQVGCRCAAASLQVGGGGAQRARAS